MTTATLVPGSVYSDVQENDSTSKYDYPIIHHANEQAFNPASLRQRDVSNDYHEPELTNIARLEQSQQRNEKDNGFLTSFKIALGLLFFCNILLAVSLFTAHRYHNFNRRL